ncbi:unnamed protein product [Adineta steineri]|uniref:Uncharacterized protein n=2 Tax=Adineta steineri TaxID=433720 RepID=A0A814LFJ6_9BILA|nr:unnamed protein product [Adineta steineri]CAF3543835.1 unnamed protein product [Adineta steineri]CAF3771006.1 unnamed protein product [Adineta steineri]
MMFWHITYLFFCLLTFTSVFCADTSCTKLNCQLPSCQCPTSNSNPTSLNVTDIPQLVLFTFVGNLNQYTFDSVRSILNPAHRNPNKCPISSTFFVNDNFTDYCLVQRLFNNHNEIAMTTSSNRCPLTNCYEENHWRQWIDNDWKREIKQQRLNLIEQAYIHHSHIKGFRVPHLQIDENKHLELIRNFHFNYDSSMLFQSSKLIWPFTLNYPINLNECMNCDESYPTMEGLWQFPLHEWTYSNTSESCRTFSDPSCLPEDEVHTADLLFDFIKYNFDRHSSLTLGQRAPFVIELDLMWLSEHQNKRLEAMLRFIEYILNSEDHRHVYFVSLEQALEWIKYPRTLNELEDFWAFSCTDTIYDYDIDCAALQTDFSSKSDAQRLISKNETNKTDTEPVDRQAEELFRSGILVHSIWIFILLIIVVLIYDKYFAKK